MTNRHNPHRGLDPLVQEIEARSDGQIGIAYAWAFNDIVPQKLGPLRRIVEYLELGLRVWKLRHNNVILIREFSTYFIFLTLVLIFPIRRKCVLLIAHNAQSATYRPKEKFFLTLLSRLGLRFACLENDAGFVSLFGRKADAVFSHPVVRQGCDQHDGDRAFHIGVAGDIRPEKNLSFVLPILECLALKDKNLRASVGTNRVDIARQIAGSLEIVDTTDHEAYLSYLAELDVLILPYPAESYKYRVSGVIAEATGMGTPVICTDLPALRAQVLTPEQGGVCLPYAQFDENGLSEAIGDVKANRADIISALKLNSESRQPARIVDDFLAQIRHL